MAEIFQQRLKHLRSSALLPQLARIRRGIEKEGLRTTTTGELAQTPHPKALGSALTHPSITTDYSEALLELITPVEQSPQAAIDYLSELHTFVYENLEEELIWPASMPCILNGEENIPIAEYGHSNIGTLKHVYRIGLAWRYGKTMQAIAGVHYNFSLPTAFWPLYRKTQGSKQTDQDFQTEQYFGLIRNYHRFSWLILYLFGASPALCRCFLGENTHQLHSLDDSTLYTPFATSLRMGDLGYQNDAQQGIDVCYNSLERYVEGLGKAIHTSHPAYEKIGIKVDGQYRQLNTNILQIENEYYSDIRPKRVTPSGQKPLDTLAAEGVEYIEVRNLDINPFLPTGIDAEQIRFMDAFLLYCLLEDSPSCEAEQSRVNVNNKARVVNEGRAEGLLLDAENGAQRTLRAWGTSLLDKVESVAELLDEVHGNTRYTQAVATQRERLADPDKTPSAQLLATLQNKHQTFPALCLELARAHKVHFMQNSLAPSTREALKSQSLQSLKDQSALEAADTLSFDEFLAQYNSL